MGSLLSFLDGASVYLGEGQGYVFEYGEMGEEVVGLEDDTDCFSVVVELVLVRV